jgi:hypothetical protein
MPFLLYGVTESAGATAGSPAGLAGAGVEEMEISGLTCFYSETPTLPPSSTRGTALEFQQVINSIFQKCDIIPFRFPTLLADRAEIKSAVETHAAEYHDGLAQIRGRAQIEVRIGFREEETQSRTQVGASSGAGYLRGRQQRHTQLKSAAKALREAAGDLIERWCEREHADNLRCFALIARASFPSIQAALAKTALSSNLVARVSGPWPATEFWKEER